MAAAALPLRLVARDMLKNLRNVALPGTGVPLSVLCVSKAAVTAIVVAGVPAYAQAHTPTHTHTHTHTHIHTHPHAHSPADLRACMAPLTESCALLQTHVPGSRAQIFHLEAEHVTADAGYALEDKRTCLHKAREAGIAVSPWWDVSSQVFVSTLSHILAFMITSINIILIFFFIPTHFRRGGMRPRRSL